MRSLALLIAVLGAACRQEAPPASVQPGVDPARAPRAEAPTAPQALAPQAPAPQGVTSPSPTAAPTVSAARARALLDVMRPSSRAAMAATTVPLLLPDDLGIAATAMVTSGERWVAASIAQGDHTIAIHATREAMSLPPGDRPAHRDRLRGVPATVSSNEGVRVATWMEDGVAYMVDVECSRPSEDPRCTQESFVRALVSGLVRVEGAR